jgi:hypothetical protein
MPAEAGIHDTGPIACGIVAWVPAFVGMTFERADRSRLSPAGMRA